MNLFRRKRAEQDGHELPADYEPPSAGLFPGADDFEARLFWALNESTSLLNEVLRYHRARVPLRSETVVEMTETVSTNMDLMLRR